MFQYGGGRCPPTDMTLHSCELKTSMYTTEYVITFVFQGDMSTIRFCYQIFPIFQRNQRISASIRATKFTNKFNAHRKYKII